MVQPAALSAVDLDCGGDGLTKPANHATILWTGGHDIMRLVRGAIREEFHISCPESVGLGFGFKLIVIVSLLIASLLIVRICSFRLFETLLQFRLLPCGIEAPLLELSLELFDCAHFDLGRSLQGRETLPMREVRHCKHAEAL